MQGNRLHFLNDENELSYDELYCLVSHQALLCLHLLLGHLADAFIQSDVQYKVHLAEERELIYCS